MIFIEVVNKTQVRLYLNGQMQIVNDTVALTQIQNDKTPITLFDSTHIQSKRFSQKVNDMALLDKVIVAEMEDELLEDASHYQFSHAEIDGQRWVSWIRGDDLLQLKMRFQAIAHRVVGLSALPLLLKQSTPQVPSLYLAKPLFYGVMADETITLPSAQAADWLNMMDLVDYPIISIDDDAVHYFSADKAQKLPNLWQHQAVSKAKSPYGLWALLILVLLGVWSINAYADYDHAKQRVSATQTAQQQLLKQVFPNAKTVDAYGRLSSEHQRIRAKHSIVKVKQLLTLLSQQAMSIKNLTIDADKRQVQLQQPISATLQTQLDKAGFSVNSTPQKTVITW